MAPQERHRLRQAERAGDAATQGMLDEGEQAIGHRGEAGGELVEADGVDARGHVELSELVSLMQRASALVFPSLYEGFGMPPLEAMACGCPVACSNAAALPEVVGDAAMLVDPDDVDGWVVAIDTILNDPERRAALSSAGRSRAAYFSGERAAAALLTAYRLATEVSRT